MAEGLFLRTITRFVCIHDNGALSYTAVKWCSI